MDDQGQPEPNPSPRNDSSDSAHGDGDHDGAGHGDGRRETGPPEPSQWGPALLTYFIFAGMGIVVTTVLAHFAGWLYLQFSLMQDQTPPAVLWPIVTLFTGGVAAALGAVGLLIRRLPLLRRVGITWAVAGAFVSVFSFTRFIPIGDGELQLAVQAVLVAAVAAVMWGVRRFRNRATTPQWGPSAWTALAVGGVTLLPWLWSGALGNPWETAYAAVLAIGLGVVSGFLLDDRFWAGFVHARAGKRFFGGGMAAGIVLLLIGSAAGGIGVGLMLAIVLSALGFALPALTSHSTRNSTVVACVVAPAAFGPLAYIDADEFFPATFGPEFGKWHFIAVGIAVAAAWLLGSGLLGPARVLASRTVPAVAALIVVAIAAAGLQAFAQPGFHGDKLFVVMKEQADLSGIDGDRTRRLEQVHDRLVATATSSQKDLRSTLDADGVTYRPFYIVNAIEVPYAPLRQSQMEARDDVDRVLRSPQARPVPAADPPRQGDFELEADTQPNLEQIHAPKAWERDARGEGITIGISDSGVDAQHPALADAYRGGDSAWADPVNGTETPNDPNGHGTHALGLALGADGIGVAPDAEWIGCANLPRNAGTPANYLACLEFMSAPYPAGGDPFADGDPQLAPHVSSNSWGCPQIEGCDETVMQPAIEALTSAGIFFVVAAGNTGPSCGSADSAPGHNPDAYSVGAVDSDNAVTIFSSRGPVSFDGEKLTKPDIAAPGQDVVSALPGGGYGKLTGTSMSSPHVAGAVAVLWSAVPELIGDVDGTTEVLAESAQPVEPGYGLDGDACGAPANSAGAGVVDVDAAVSLAQERYADA